MMYTAKQKEYCNAENISYKVRNISHKILKQEVDI